MVDHLARQQWGEKPTVGKLLDKRAENGVQQSRPIVRRRRLADVEDLDPAQQIVGNFLDVVCRKNPAHIPHADRHRIAQERIDEIRVLRLDAQELVEKSAALPRAIRAPNLTPALSSSSIRTTGLAQPCSSPPSGDLPKAFASAPTVAPRQGGPSPVSFKMSCDAAI